jgi:hypothetical protein
MPNVNKNCTTCEFDKETTICSQGHVREWYTEIVRGLSQLPIQDCHAWKEREKEKGCICSRVKIFSSASPDIFDIVCRACGRKKEFERGG